MSRKTNIIATCLSDIPSALVGVREPLLFLKERGSIDFLFKESMEVDVQDIIWADVLVCIRGSEEIEIDIVREFKRLGKYVIYFLDDDLLNIPQYSKSFLYYSNKSVKQNICDIMKLSDCLWTTSINIKNKYGSNFSKAEVLQAPALLLGDRIPEAACSSDKLVIGFSGGVDHKHFLEEMLEAPIKKVLKKYGDKVEFEFFGAHPSFIEGLNLKYIPHKSEHSVYREVMLSRKWDIALAPLQNSEFHSCKYINKYLEYGAVGAAGIYSNVEPYTHVIQNGINGILVENTCDAWVEAISYLVDNAVVRSTIVSKAYEQVRNDFSLEPVSSLIIEKIPELVSYTAPTISKGMVKFTPGKNRLFLYRAMSLIKREKFKVPFYVVKKLFSYNG